MNHLNKLQFAKDMQEWLKEKEFNYKETAMYTGIPVSTVQKMAHGYNVKGEALVIMAYWMDFDLRDYVIDDEGWGRQLKLSLK